MSRRTSRHDKAAALAQFRSVRNGEADALLAALPDDDNNDDDVYEEVTEEEYAKVVASRREREDFIVDDAGLGYADDGEEIMYMQDADTADANNSKRRKSATASLNPQVLKKARKQIAATTTTTDNKNQPTMWNFLNKPTSQQSNSHSKNSSRGTATVNVEDLLSELDTAVVPSTTRRGRSKAPSTHSRRRTGSAAYRRSTRMSAGNYRAPEEEEEAAPFHDMPDDDDDAGMMPMDNDDDDDDADATPTNVEADNEDRKKAAVSEETTTGKKVHWEDASAAKEAAAPVSDAEKQDEAAMPAPPTRRIARPKLGKVERKQAPPAVSTVAPKIVTQANLPSVDIAAVEASNNTTLAGQLDLDEYLNGNESVDMFWMDLTERNGEVFLFGKVPYKDTFVSACVIVGGNVRNLFVLPKSEANLQDVHAELSDVLESVLPSKAGTDWAAKPVERNYAFDDPTIPRVATQYLKVVYDAKYPAPPETTTGTHFSKILGTQTSLTETFIIKRKLMGPCWIRVAKPTKVNGSLSWCKLECTVNTPKAIVRIDNPPPSPPVVTMTLHMKTVVNPKSHKSEIVAISAVCHAKVPLDAAAPESNRHVSQLTMVRPVDHQFPRDFVAPPGVHKEPNERALLGRFLAQLGQWDPDVLCGHNILGFDLTVLLTRCRVHKIGLWSKIGRRRRSDWPSNEYTMRQAAAGRLVADTYLSAQENWPRETMYSLTHLANSQLQAQRQEIDPVDVPLWFQTTQSITQLAQVTLYDAHLVQRLLFKLQTLPLSKQLTCIAGNLWSQTLKSNRAVRTEFLLLHEFHRLKFLPPEKKKKAPEATKFAGGLVLEPKRGLYDSFILLLDFNSLYPSIIQEYNLCFTTMEWAGGESHLPDSTAERGVLPRVIKSLVERRRAVKKILKSERDPDKKKELDIRQTALKLTANSMYGCLGFANSRFYAQPIAAMVTSLGRETLQRTVDKAEQEVGLDVIYGDTDSIMINTRITDEKELKKVKELGEKVKREVNKTYKTLELEIDGIFRPMLLLKKKKYAAKTVEELPNGEGIKYGKELKGLDLVRRDWCIQSRDTGRYITDQILSGEDSEAVLENIHTHLEEIAKRMRAGELPLEKYIITKGLSKHPNEYPDGKSQIHVQVAKRMLANGKAVNTGAHIPYVVTEALEGQEPIPTPAERARYPDEIVRSNGSLKPDVEWYLTQQILPPIYRLCEPIEGTTQQLLAEKLGLDSTKYNNSSLSNGPDQEVAIDYTPISAVPDVVRYKDVEKLKMRCFACNHEDEFPGVFHISTDRVSGQKSLVSGLKCTNPDCMKPNWGYPKLFECFCSISNYMDIWVRGLTTKYYEGSHRCDEPMCRVVTHQVSVAAGTRCLERGCHGQMTPLMSERDVHTHLKYLESLFNMEHKRDRLVSMKMFGTKREIENELAKTEARAFQELHKEANRRLEQNAYHWVSPTFWSDFFRVGPKQ